MIQRILDIIKQKNLTPAQFAEEVGIQRSSISHLVSGRNKPSLEFIQKILSTYPEISTEWLLTGSGEMLKSDQSSNLRSMDLFENDETVPEIISEQKEPVENESEVKNIQPAKALKEAIKPVRKRINDPSEGKQVEKIVYFYKDQSFREYYPDNS